MCEDFIIRRKVVHLTIVIYETSSIGESRGLVVKGEDSQLSGCGFESLRRILDGVSEASYYIEKGNKGSQMGHTKKIFKKKNLLKLSLIKLG